MSENTPESQPETQPDTQPDTQSDPGLDDTTGSDWSDEGGATEVGPATETEDS